MPQQVTTAVQNDFTKGLVTEFTGLNFPENACTDTDNCDFTLVGDVTRRLGIDFEVNGNPSNISRVGQAVNTYKWKNVGGDGNTQLIVTQVGSLLYFWSVTDATIASPLTDQRLISTVNAALFSPGFETSLECQFTDGNGYLFVFHPNCHPFYCTYTAGTITATLINLQIRDFTGIPEQSVADNTRPSVLTAVHNYNLINQGWTQGNPWNTISTSTVTVGVGAKVFTVPAGLTITPGQSVYVVVLQIRDGTAVLAPELGNMVATVSSYAGTTLTLSVSSTGGSGGTYSNWSITPISTGYINTWFTDIGNYPSNADQWWRFKTAAGTFSPVATQANTSIGSGPAPKGHIITNAFIQERTALSGVTGLTDVITQSRPTNGTWFQGRVWYTGVSASNPASGTAPYTTWTENIYFSQVVDDASDFGKCYQENDPTSEELFELLPTDGGVITIQGSGTVYRLFPIQNGLLVFAANGIWFITGSQGIGFSASDYTITKLSSIESISCTSYVDVQGLPYFWNEDGIYSIQPQQGGGLGVNSITYTTLDTFFSEIPLDSKKFARGAYDPINSILRWIYRSEEEENLTDRYTFDRALTFNTINKSFSPWTIDTTSASVNGIDYINSPGGSDGVLSTFKYLSSTDITLGFSDEHDEDYVDWASIDPVSFESFFVTGYSLRGQAIRKFQIQYLQMYSRTNDTYGSYRIQGLWDYSNTGNSGRWTTLQFINIPAGNYGMVFRRHKIRGNGYAVQIKVRSNPGDPFDIMGWSVVDTVNAGT